MKNFLIICLLQLLFSFVTFAQNENKPFALLDEQVKSQLGGWNGSKQNLSGIFNQERISLGAKFETELLIYIGNDVEKHYWIALFLDSESYLHGNEPLPELALSLREKALKILRNKTGEGSAGRRFSISIQAAVASEKLGRREQAESYKREAELLVSVNKNLSAYFPAMSEYKRCLYQNIGQASNPCKPEDFTHSTERRINAGVVNGKAVNLVKPKYPKKARKIRASGMVRVRVVIDEQGKVITAEPIDGHSDLYDESVRAALKSTFSSTTLEGKPVKVSGVIIYNFSL